jgi:hypothetical protein
MSLPSDRLDGIMITMNPKDTMRSYFETWNARDFDAFQALFADDVSFAGPLGRAQGPVECRRGIEGMSRLIDRAEIRTMLAEGQDVITWFELHRSGADPVPVANWSQVEAGKVRRVRVTFDPRPLLG